jgi:biopolymer transport protein ExbD
MEIPQRSRPEVRINLSPLIDVIFILLIFVVLVARFIDQEKMNVEVPTSEAGEPQAQQALVLYLLADGRLRFEGADLPREKLEAMLTARRQTYRELLIIADKKRTVQDAVDLLSTARRLGFEKAGLATQDENP